MRTVSFELVKSRNLWDFYARRYHIPVKTPLKKDLNVKRFLKSSDMKLLSVSS